MAETILLNNRIDEKLVDVRITDITWNRVHIEFSIDVINNETNKNLDYYLVSTSGFAVAKFKAGTEENKNIISVNYTNPGYRRCIPEGAYSIYAVEGEDILCKLETTLEYAPKVHEASRYFIHNGSTDGYLVNFSLEESDIGLFIRMTVFDSVKEPMGIKGNDDMGVKSKNPVNKKKQFKKKFKKSIKRRGQRFVQCYYNVAAKLMHSNKKTILIMSEQNEVMKSNLKAVYDRIYERGLDKEFNIKTSFRSMVSKTRRIGALSWISTVNKLAKADMIFVDDHCPVLDWLVLSNKTTLIQLWHAGAGYKGVGYSRWGHKGCPAPYCCHRQYDYCITPSSNIGFFFSEQFGINDSQIVSTGMPRMDKYLDENNKKETIARLTKDYPIIENKKVILFAPTYRGVNKKQAMYPYDLIDFDRLYDFCGDEYVVIFKMHPWVKQPVPISEQHQDRFIDLNTYPDINDLFYITDLFISDYSSGVFEYSLMRKPALFFAFDELSYSYTRGFHRDYRTSTPGKICNTFEELMKALEEKDYEFEKMESYINYHFEFFDSNSTDRVIDYFMLGKLPQKNIDAIENDRKEIENLKNLNFQSIK